MCCFDVATTRPWGLVSTNLGRFLPLRKITRQIGLPLGCSVGGEGDSRKRRRGDTQVVCARLPFARVSLSLNVESPTGRVIAVSRTLPARMNIAWDCQSERLARTLRWIKRREVNTNLCASLQLVRTLSPAIYCVYSNREGSNVSQRLFTRSSRLLVVLFLL